MFCLFLSVSLCFSLAFFGLPLFQFLFLCLSLVLFFFSSFLSFFFAFFWFLVFVSFFPSLSYLLLFHERNNMQIVNYKGFFVHQSFLFVSFPVLFSLSNPLFLSLLFLILSYVFCSTSMFLVSKQTSWKTAMFGQEGSCNKTFILWTCVLQNVESYRFLWALFGQILVCSKATIQIGMSAHF